MSYAQENGYTPVDIAALLEDVRVNVNNQFGTSYTELSFVGTNWYKYFYALMQKVQEGEVKTAEIFIKLQEYITTTNERIQRPSVSAPGLLDSFADTSYNGGLGYIASVKPPEDADAGKIFICVDTDEDADDYADKKLEICTLIKNFVAAGLVSQGSEVESITLSNGQAFDFKFALPTRIPTLVRATLVESENNILPVPDDVTIREAIFANINARYRLGYNFEPQRYYNSGDALWAQSVLVEWSVDAGANWFATVNDLDFDELLTYGLADITVVVS